MYVSMDVVNDNRRLDPLVREEKIIGVLGLGIRLLCFLCSDLPTTPHTISGMQTPSQRTYTMALESNPRVGRVTNWVDTEVDRLLEVTTSLFFSIQGHRLYEGKLGTGCLPRVSTMDERPRHRHEQEQRRLRYHPRPRPFSIPERHPGFIQVSFTRITMSLLHCLPVFLPRGCPPAYQRCFPELSSSVGSLAGVRAIWRVPVLAEVQSRQFVVVRDCHPTDLHINTPGMCYVGIHVPFLVWIQYPLVS